MESKDNNYIERYWRDATPADAIKEPPMVARFKTDDPGPVRYIIDKLVGVIRTNAWMWRTANGGYLHCQVYDAPDPGEGWRLIDVDKETPKEGDQYLVHPSQWIDRGDCHGCFKDDKFYRRRIEQPKPEPKYVPFEWEDREQLRGRWIVDRDDRWEEVIHNVSKTPDGILYANGYRSDYLMSAWTFIDTGEPVGKRVV